MATAAITPKAKHTPIAKKKLIGKKEPASKKLKPASVAAQKAWQGFPSKLKKELRKKLPDSDKDRVPDGFDCRPRDRKRQESFLPADEAFLSSNPSIRLGKHLGAGCEGEVFTVAGNKNMVVKVPLYFASSHGNTPSDRARYLEWRREDIEDEFKFYKGLDLNNKPLFIPTVATSMRCGFNNRDYTCLVRPKVTPLRGTNRYGEPIINPGFARKMTKRKLEEIRRKLIHISHMGIALTDGLQIGVDSAGRPLIYDVGRMRKYSPGDNYAFEVNNSEWLSLLYDLGISDCREYGEVTKNENY